MALIKNADAPPPTHLLNLLRSLWQWRKPIIVFTLAGAILAAIVSMLLPVYFTASTSFLTISPDQISIDGVFGGEGYTQFYGTGDDIDRLMSVAESDALVDHMVETFRLYAVYDIDSTKKKAPVSVRKEFLGNYGVTKTPRDAIELEIADQDPERAAAMARAARVKINEISLNLIRNTQRRSAESLRGEVVAREQSLADLNERVRQLRAESGIYNTYALAEALAVRNAELDESLAMTQAKIDGYRQRGGRGAQDSIAKYAVQLDGLGSARVALDSQLYRLNGVMGQLNNIEEERRDLNEALSEDRVRLKQFESILRSEQRALEVIEEAKVPVVKSYPVRSLIVVGSAIFCFIAAVMGALLIDTGRRYDWGEVFRE